MLKHLKSSMERFIGEKTLDGQSVEITFKIQYGEIYSEPVLT